MPLTQLVSLQMNFLIFLGSFLYSKVICITVHIHSKSPSYSLLIPSVFSLSPFWTQCLLDCRGLFHCFLLQGKCPVLVSGNGSWASSFCLYFSYSVSLGKPTTVVLEGIYMQKHPWIFCEDLLFIFGVRAAFWFGCCYLFPQCVQTVIPLTGCCLCFQGDGGNGQG